MWSLYYLFCLFATYIYNTNWIGRGIWLLYDSFRIVLLVVYIYMHTYLSTPTNIVPWTDQVYQNQITQNNHSTWTYIPGIQYFLTGKFSLIPLTKLQVRFLENILQFILSVFILHNCTRALLDINVTRV